MLSRIDRYILRQTLTPMAVTLLIAAMLLILEKMLRLFDFVINQGGPINVVWRMLGNLVPQYLGLALPIGLFLGVLLAFRKLALSSELDALTSAGIGHLRLLRMPLLVAIATMMVNTLLLGFIQPLSRYRFEGLQFDLRSGALGASIKVGEFVHVGDDITLRVEESQGGGGRLLRVFLAREAKNGGRIMVSAAAGSFFATDDHDRIIFRLYDGTLVTMDEQFGHPRALTFAVHDLPVDLPKSEIFRRRGQEHLELTLPELWTAQFDPARTVEERRAVRANLHFRLTQIISLLFLPFLGLALAVPPKRSQSAVGVFLGIVILVVYHETNQFAESFSAKGAVPIEPALWLPWGVLGGISLWFFHILTSRPGGQPLAGLDVLMHRLVVLGRYLHRLMRRVVPS